MIVACCLVCAAWCFFGRFFGRDPKKQTGSVEMYNPLPELLNPAGSSHPGNLENYRDGIWPFMQAFSPR